MSVFGKALTEVRGKDATFENFVQGLCCELLGQRSEWSCDRSVNKRLVTSTLTWKDRKPIQQAIDRIEGHSRKTFRDETSVLDLVETMLRKLRSCPGFHKKHTRSSKPGQRACLVFVRDQGSGGGEEILRLVRSKVRPHLEKWLEDLDIQIVEVNNRSFDRGPRKVVNWIYPATSQHLETYDGVAIVDDVAHTGNTLEVVRGYLCSKTQRKEETFTAALLLASQETEASLRKNRWIVVCADGYHGHEVVFPWGWTRATTVMDPKNASDCDEGWYALHSRLPHILWLADPPTAHVLYHL